MQDRLRVGAFVVDLGSGEVCQNGNLIRLKPQVCRVLSLLVAQPGRIVAREEIQHAVWGEETFVDFERGLNSCIKQIRAALNDDPDLPRYVETIPRRGYRLIAPVEALACSQADLLQMSGQKHRAPLANRLPIHQRAIWAFLLVVSVVVATLGITRGHLCSNNKIRIVVLPFDNLDPNPEERYLSDGLSEELITELGKLAPQRLGVIARTSSAQLKQAHKSALEIGKALEVDYILEGTLRHDGDLVHVTAQLIKTSDQTQVWAATYDQATGQTFQVEQSVASAVEHSLGLRAPRDRTSSSKPATQHIAAHEAYLRGRFELNRMTLEGIRKARTYFEQAVQRDPKFALAHVGIADTYTLEPWWGGLSPREAFPQAKAAANHALGLDEDLAETHSALGVIHFYYDWDFSAAEKEFQRAIDLQPGLAIAHYWYAGLLSASGQHREAVSSIQKAQELDPLSPLVNADAGWYYFYARDYDDAIRECGRALEVDPEFGFAVNCQMASHRMQGQLQAAVADAGRLLQIRASKMGEPPPSLAAPDPQTGLQNAARVWLSRISRLSKQFYISPYQTALLHLLVHDNDQAIADLNRAYEQRDLLLVLLDVDPRLDGLRADQRFRELQGKWHRALDFSKAHFAARAAEINALKEGGRSDARRAEDGRFGRERREDGATVPVS